MVIPPYLSLQLADLLPTLTMTIFLLREAETEVFQFL